MASHTGKIDMIRGSIIKSAALFALPICVGNILQQLYGTVDTLVVGNFCDSAALAAVGTATQPMEILLCVFLGIGNGASILVSQEMGRRNADGLRMLVRTAVWFLYLCAIPVTILAMFVGPALLRLMQVPADAFDYAVLYLRITALGTLGNLGYNMNAGILRGLGDSRSTLLLLLISCLTNIVLDIVFVIGLHMGVAGAALATILSQALSAVLVLWVLMRTKDMHRLELRKIRFDGRMFHRIIRIGLPAGLQSVMYTSSNILIQSSVNALGTDTVAAWTAYSKIDSLFWMIVNAFGISITTFVGQNFGAGKYHRMRKSVSVCMIMSMVSSAVLIILMYSFAPWIYRLFTTDSAVVVHGVHMSRFLLPSYFIYVIIGILSGALRGTGKVLVPMLLTCGGVCSLRILWLFTAGQIYPGINTIMLSYPVSWSITAVLFIVYYFMKFPGKKKEN